ncbi:UDP-2,3-diacylglucosamine diphosphatase [Lebetimonas sp. JH292]|uniref:UDP-2,3-diacylglucosamine diphosphatase n=1 Tax=Lebetimonas sp. JH292 TaxID=990068 RepID=UPI0004663B24|nr:metallophosphoesterase [Lebetimonas sp. JH292]
MRIKEIDIKNGAVFIADSHYKKGDKSFLNFLNFLVKKNPPQVFFMGDIFHLLLPFEYLKKYNQEAIELINKLSKKTEVYYIYGNHDFCIDEFFPAVTFADAFTDIEKSVYLSHGDLDNESFFYKLYSMIIRNKITLNLIHIFSFNFVNNWLFKKFLNKKIKCQKIDLNLNIAKKYDYIIIGHYHISKSISSIKILPSFFCSGKYNIIQLDNKIKFKELNYGR